MVLFQLLERYPKPFPVESGVPNAQPRRWPEGSKGRGGAARGGSLITRRELAAFRRDLST